MSEPKKDRPPDGKPLLGFLVSESHDGVRGVADDPAYEGLDWGHLINLHLGISDEEAAASDRKWLEENGLLDDDEDDEEED